jgi:hypothetical protein
VKRSFILLFFISLSLLQACAQLQKLNTEEEAAYTKAITQRAEKIVAALALTDSAKFFKVRDIIANQYRNLNDIHTSRDAAIKTIKAKGREKELLEEQIKKTKEVAATSIAKLHTKYVADLSSLLTEKQVEQVKDGMTYGVVPITYKGYMEMLPNLTEKQKEQIRTWLVEAREIAMDAETSEKKHGWFGKYKGKINNYLSTAGYDMKKAGQDWEKRIKEKEQQAKTQ